MKTTTRAGIIGGLGPETSAKFCINIITKFRKITNGQPDLVMENLPITAEAERDLITGRITNDHRILLKTAVTRLNNLEVDFIAIPCNTVHCFLPELRAMSRKPILSIIEECAKECRKKNFKKVGLLASPRTIQDKLFENEFMNKRIGIMVPSEEDQKNISEVTLKILNQSNTDDDKQKILRIASKLKDLGAGAIILGCTDLSLIIDPGDCLIPVLQTDKILEDSVIRKLLN